MSKRHTPKTAERRYKEAVRSQHDLIRTLKLNYSRSLRQSEKRVLRAYLRWKHPESDIGPWMKQNKERLSQLIPISETGLEVLLRFLKATPDE